MSRMINILIGGLLLVSSGIVNAEPEVLFSKWKVKSSVGATVSVDVLMVDFPNTEGGGIELQYNPALVNVNSVTVDESTWSFVNKDGDIDNTNGTVSEILFSSYKGVSGSAKIATVELEFVGRGKDSIMLNESDSNPFASNGDVFSVSFKPMLISVRGKRK